MTAAPSMPHRMLGRTGLQVSVLSYGFWATFGVKEGLTDDEGIERAKECLSTARAGGVNLFDNAEVYGSPRGEAERVMGEALAQLADEEPVLWRRSDILVTTKIFWGGDGVNEKGLSRKHVREGLEASLTRLQLEYVDLVFCHRPDPFTPTETVVRAMTDMVQGGLATAWGTSEWSAQQITEACWLARTLGLEPPQFEQPQYNMFHRERVEQEYHPLYRQPYGIGLTTWSPLMSGILTGKYNDTIPEGSRLTQPGYEFLQKTLAKQQASGAIDKVRELTAFAKAELGCSMTQLALAWAVKNPHVTTVLLGATKPAQLQENLGAIAVARALTDAHMARIEEILANKPAAYGGYGGAGMRGLDTI
jgi:voltage-dependent potassium channel beta subunit